MAPCSWTSISSSSPASNVLDIPPSLYPLYVSHSNSNSSLQPSSPCSDHQCSCLYPPLLHSPHLWGRELILAPSSGMQRRQWLTSSSFIHKFTIMLSQGPSTHSAPLNSCFSNSSVSTIYCKLNCTKIRFNSIVDQGPWLGCQYWSALCLIGHPTNIGRVQSE